VPEVRTPTEVVLAGYAAWNSGDLEAFIETVHPDVVWKTSGVFPGLRPSYSGHAGMRGFWNTFQDPWESLQIEIEEIAEVDGDSVLLLVHFHATGRDGIEVDRRMANYLRVREEKLFRMQVYPDWEQALAALGIEDPREGATAP
jgi:ketosteroid isomerase-like protein